MPEIACDFLVISKMPAEVLTQVPPVYPVCVISYMVTKLPRRGASQQTMHSPFAGSPLADMTMINAMTTFVGDPRRQTFLNRCTKHG